MQHLTRVGTYFKPSPFAPFDYSQYIDDGVLRSVITINFPMGPVCGSAEVDSPVGAPAEWAKDYNWSFEVFPRYKLNDCGGWGIDDPMNLKNYGIHPTVYFTIKTWLLTI